MISPMNNNQKLDLIIQAILKVSPLGYPKVGGVKLILTTENKLNQFSKLEILRILEPLAQKEVIKIPEINYHSSRTRSHGKIIARYEEQNGKEIRVLIPKEEHAIVNDYLPKDTIILSLCETFTTWHDSYVRQKKIKEYSDKLSDLSPTNLAKVCSFFTEVDEEFQLKEEPIVRLPFEPTTYPKHNTSLTRENADDNYNKYVKPRLDALNYLVKIEVIKEYDVDTINKLHAKYEQANYLHITLNTYNYENFKSAVQNFTLPRHQTTEEKIDVENNMTKSKLKKAKTTKLKTKKLKVTFNDNTREVLINGRRLAKPDLDSTNDRFMEYIIQHPNKLISRKDIEENIGNLGKKTLHKIVQNLKFTGRHKAFFSISKNNIRFNNPLTLP
jgi:hypothetical protein